MFAIDSQPNGEEGSVNDGWNFSASTTTPIKKKKKTKKTVAKESIVEEPAPAPEPEMKEEDDPWSFTFGGGTKDIKKKKKKGAIASLLEPEPELEEPKMMEEPSIALEEPTVEEPPPPPPEPESVVTPEPTPLTEQPTNIWGDWDAAAAPAKKSKKNKKSKTAIAVDCPEPPVEEIVSVQTPQIVVEPSPEEAGVTSDLISQQPLRSPYTEPPVMIYISSDNITHYVPRHLLPPQWKDQAYTNLVLHDMTIETGHTLVHYLYTGAYETLNTSTTLDASTGLKHALLVYIATTSHNLPDLQRLAVHTMEMHAERLDIFEILEAIQDDFTRLEPDSWVHGFLRKKAQAAFEADHSVFRNDAFLRTLDNVVLGKVLMRWVMEMYDEKVSRMIAVAEDTSRMLGECNQVVQSHDMVVDEQDLVVPVVDEGPTEEYPAEACPAEEYPAEEYPAEACPAEEYPAEEYPAEACPAEEYPADAYPAEEYPAEACSAEEYSAEACATEAYPTEACPVEERPTEECYSQEVFERGSVSTEGFCTISCPSEEGAGREDEALMIEENLSRSTERVSNEWEEAEIPAAEEAAEPQLEAIGQEPVISPFAGLNKLQTMKLQKRMRIEARRKAREEAAELLQQEQEAEAQRIRQEEAKLREEEEAAAAAAAAAAATVALEPEPVSDAEPKVCRLRAKHMLKEKRWMKCKSCRAIMQQIAVRLSHADLDEENLQDLDKVLVI